MFIPYKIEDFEHEFRFRPVFCVLLCLACLGFGGAVFQHLPKESLEDLAYTFGAVPIEFRWWSPLTCTFLHGDWLHLAGNLYFLWIYGSALERSVGQMKFLAIYIVGAFASVWAHVLTVPPWMADIPTIGASGAISAVLGAFLVLMPNVKIRFLVVSPLYSRPLPSHGPAHFVLGGWFLIQILYGLKAVGDVGEVAFWAHIAGFGAGAVLAFCIERLEAFLKTRKGLEGDEDAGAQEPSLAAAMKSASKEKALPVAVAAFAKARDAYDAGLAAQSYFWMLESFDEASIPAWVHRDAAQACLKMKLPEMALHAFARASAAGCVDDPQKALAGFRAALEKAGDSAKAEAASRLMADLFPDTLPEQAG